MELEFAIGAGLAGRVRLGLLVIEGVSVRENDAALAAEVDAECAALRARYGDGKSAEVPGAADARTLYKALGIDPTKTRPSNEALLRRALKGETLYRINTLVDALNLLSLREQLPFGLYDLDRVRPPVELRRGACGRGLRGHPQGPGPRRGPAGAGRRGGAVRQPDLGLAAHMITLAHEPLPGGRLRPGRLRAARLDGVLDGTAAALTQAAAARSRFKRRTLP